jgi:hypothetical protein
MQSLALLPWLGKLIYDGAEDHARVTVTCIYKLGLGVEEKNCQNMKE